MSLKKCCSSNEEKPEADVNVNIIVDVPKIVKYVSIAGILIVGIIFGTKTFRKMMDEGYFDQIGCK